MHVIDSDISTKFTKQNMKKKGLGTNFNKHTITDYTSKSFLDGLAKRAEKDRHNKSVFSLTDPSSKFLI